LEAELLLDDADEALLVEEALLAEEALADIRAE